MPKVISESPTAGAVFPLSTDGGLCFPRDFFHILLLIACVYLVVVGVCVLFLFCFWFVCFFVT